MPCGTHASRTRFDNPSAAIGDHGRPSPITPRAIVHAEPCVSGRLSAAAQTWAFVVIRAQADQPATVTITGIAVLIEKVAPWRPRTIVASTIIASGGHPPARNAHDANRPAIHPEPFVNIRFSARIVPSPAIRSTPASAERSISASWPNQASASSPAALAPIARFMARQRISPMTIPAIAAGQRTIPSPSTPPTTDQSRLGRTDPTQTAGSQPPSDWPNGPSGSIAESPSFASVVPSSRLPPPTRTNPTAASRKTSSIPSSRPGDSSSSTSNSPGSARRRRSEAREAEDIGSADMRRLLDDGQPVHVRDDLARLRRGRRRG